MRSLVPRLIAAAHLRRPNGTRLPVQGRLTARRPVARAAALLHVDHHPDSWVYAQCHRSSGLPEAPYTTIYKGPCIWSGRARVPDRPGVSRCSRAVELHSTFVGHTAVPTHVSHLLLGPVGQPPRVVTRDDESGIIDPVNRPDSCIYAHCHELIDLLDTYGLDLAVDRLPTRLVPLPR